MIFDNNPADVRLVPFSGEHVAATFEWVKDPELRRMFLMRGELTPEGHRAYFEKVLLDPHQKIFAIFAGGRHVGNCGLKNISALKEEAEVWVYIGSPVFRKKGIGLIATRLLIREGAAALELKRFYLHVAEFNRAARGLYKKAGFADAPQGEVAGEWSGRGCRIVRMELIKEER